MRQNEDEAMTQQEHGRDAFLALLLAAAGEPRTPEAGWRTKACKAEAMKPVEVKQVSEQALLF
jgi:hypothetical protein